MQVSTVFFLSDPVFFSLSMGTDGERDDLVTIFLFPFF